MRERDRGWFDPESWMAKIKRDISVDELVPDLEMLLRHAQGHDQPDDGDHGKGGDRVIDQDHPESQSLHEELMRVAVDPTLH